MGNECCGQQPDINFINGQAIERPQLSMQLENALRQRKPFDKKQPLHQTRMKYGDDIYEGKIDLKNQPFGYGKIYKNDGSLFIGTFDQGVVKGKGYYFLSDGTYFQGSTKNNMINDKKGIIKGHHMQYHGEIVNNKLEGEGQEKDPNGQTYKFEGIYKNNQRFKGTLTWEYQQNKFQYRGYFGSDNKFTKSGTLIEPSGTYEGQFKHGKKHGRGKFVYFNRLKYVGEYDKGVKSGKGTLFNSDGQVGYDGEWKNNLPHGKGIFRKANGQYQEGQFINGIDTDYLTQQYIKNAQTQYILPPEVLQESEPLQSSFLESKLDQPPKERQMVKVSEESEAPIIKLADSQYEQEPENIKDHENISENIKDKDHENKPANLKIPELKEIDYSSILEAPNINLGDDGQDNPEIKIRKIESSVIMTSQQAREDDQKKKPTPNQFN